MKIEIKAAILILLSSLTLLACNHSNKSIQQQNSKATDTPHVTRLLRDMMNERVVDTTIPKTSISFESTTFDFGDVKNGDVVTHKFRFKNSGTNPLIIYNVQGTCGCTVPSWSPKPINPGDTESIAIQYNSRGENGLQNKKVRVFSNSRPMETDILFKADVKN